MHEVNEAAEDGAAELRSLLAFENAGLLRTLCAPADPGARVRTVTVGLDDLDTGPAGSGSLLLAVGAAPDAATVREAARRGARAVVLSHVPGEPGGPDDQVPPALLDAARETGVAVLARADGTGWGEIAALLRSALTYARAAAREPARDPFPDLGTASSLTALAARVAASVKGAVTIEDTGLRVLAHSPTRPGADPLRQSVVLQGRVPAWRVAELRRSGLLRRLWTSSEVLHRPASDQDPERLVVAVRDGRELLGSIWAAADSGAMAPDAARHLRHAAALAAPLLVRERLRESGETRQREAALRGLLHGLGDRRTHAWALGLPGDAPYAVAVAERERSGPDDDRSFDLLALEASAHPAGAVTLRDGDRMAMLLKGESRTASGAGAVNAAVRGLRETVASLPDPVTVRVGIGPTVPIERVDESYDRACLAVRALRVREVRAAAEGTPRPERCAESTALGATVEVLRVLDAVRPVWDSGHSPVHDMIRADRAAGGELVRTLAAYFDSAGDVPEAARRLSLHPNSLRYRLRRVRERYGVDLDEPDTALLIALAVRVAAGQRGAAPC
ncbi:PucR family transcriptional regulator [Streptomyces sp. NPDC088789]|uniref:PucR family transcriptional regulator n=1 Tax=Streptomyces sp. NPDC088789 TaxID=3365899 RepID=UPI003828AFC7